MALIMVGFVRLSQERFRNKVGRTNTYSDEKKKKTWRRHAGRSNGSNDGRTDEELEEYVYPPYTVWNYPLPKEGRYGFGRMPATYGFDERFLKHVVLNMNAARGDRAFYAA